MRASPLRLVQTLIALIALAGCAAAPPAAEPRAVLSFVLIGDMPYGAREAEAFDRLLDTINADPDLRFVLHVGDLKGGGEPCSDALLRERHRQLQRIGTALVYTPGDNDWTDCHRPAAGRFVPLERLAFLRALFYGNARRTSGQRPFAVEPQSLRPDFGEFAENVLFVRERVVFASLHVVGSDNGLVPWSGIDADDTRARPRADRVREVERRTAAALDWLDRAFERARTIDAAGVFLIMQANPRFDLPPGRRERAPFDALLARLHERATAFGRPVVIAHGDFHELIVDEPLAATPNLTRVQTFGSPRIGWIRVDVDPSLPALFRITPH